MVFTRLALPRPMVRLWVPVAIALSIVAGGLLTLAPVAPPAAASAPNDSPPGLVRVIENVDPDQALLVGFELDLHEDDWGRAGNDLRTEIAIAPFGALTGWAYFIFEDDADPARMLLSMPADIVLFPTGENQHRPASMGTAVTDFEEDEPRTYRMVVAIVGAGGIAVAPRPDWPGGSNPTAEELLALPTGPVTPIGTGTGFFLEEYMDVTSLGVLGGKVRFGTPRAEYPVPPASFVPTPVLALKTTTTAPAGWAQTWARYTGYDAQGAWAGSIDGDRQYAWEGVITEHWQPPTYWVEQSIVGGSAFFGRGATSTPHTVTFQVAVANVDVFELYRLQHIALGTPLEHLIGLPVPPFTAGSFGGLVGEVREMIEPRTQVQGQSLVTTIGELEIVLFDAVPPQWTDALNELAHQHPSASG